MRPPYPPFRRLLRLTPLLFGAVSCTLYQPLLPTPLAVRQRGEVALAANWQVPYGGQVSGSWSPVAHGLVFATGAAHFYNARRDSSNDYTRNRQYEAGVGGYATLGRAWLSGAVGGGQGWGYRFGKFQSVSLIGGGGVVPVPGGGSGGARPRIPESEGYFTSRFAQLAAWWPDPRRDHKEWGATLRYNQLAFTGLTRNGQPQPLPTQHNVQVGLAIQCPLRLFSWQPAAAYWQMTAAYTLALEKVADESAFAPAPLRVGVGAVFYPFRKKTPAAGAAK